MLGGTGIKIKKNKNTLGSVCAVLLIMLLIMYSYFGAAIRVVLSIMIIIGLLSLNITERKECNYSSYVWQRISIFICLGLIVIRNMDFENGMYGRFLYLLVAFFFIAGMSTTITWIDIGNRLLFISGMIALFFSLISGIEKSRDLIVLILMEALFAISLASVYIKKHVTIYYIILTVLIGGFILIGKLGFILFTICSVLVMHYIKSSEKTKVVLIIFFFLLAILGTIFLLFVGFDQIVKVLFSDEVTNGRTLLYRKAIEYFMENPLWGLGWAGYRHTFNIQRNGIYYEAHNVYLQLLCETGIIGIACYILFFVINIRQSLLVLRNVKNMKDDSYKKYIYFALYLQIFFLFYGISGNFLYDLSFLLYAYASAIPWAIIYKMKMTTAQIKD